MMMASPLTIEWTIELLECKLLVFMSCYTYSGIRTRFCEWRLQRSFEAHRPRYAVGKGWGFQVISVQKEDVKIRRLMTSGITRWLEECQIDRFDIADRLYTFEAPIFLPSWCILTPITNNCARSTSRVEEARKGWYTVSRGTQNWEQRQIVESSIITSTSNHITRCYSSLRQLIGECYPNCVSGTYIFVQPNHRSR